MILAQVPSYSLAQWLIIVIVVAAVIAIAYVVLQQMGVAIPPFLIKIFWIIVACLVGIVAIRLVLRIAGVDV